MNHPTLNVAPCAAAVGAPQAEPDVGEILRRMDVDRTVTDEELEQHAADCTRLMEEAYQRFEQHGNPADREEALLWMTRRDAARKALSPAWKAAREAEIQRRIATVPALQGAEK